MIEDGDDAIELRLPAELRVTGDGAWTRSPQVRLSGRGSVEGTVRVDGWGAGEQNGDDTVIRSADLELRLARFPRPVATSTGSEAMRPAAPRPMQAQPAPVPAASFEDPYGRPYQPQGRGY